MTTPDRRTASRHRHQARKTARTNKQTRRNIETNAQG